MERNIGSVERVLSVAAGAAMMAYAIGRSQRTRPAPAALATGAGLIGRGLAGYCPVSAVIGRKPRDTRAALAGRRGIHVRTNIRINRAPHDVFRFWRNLSNLPQFMDHLVDVRELDATRSRWTAKGPAGTSVTWDAEIIHEIDGELIGWRSLSNADVATAGSVRFLPAPGGGTDVVVKLQYDPPAGAVGSWVASLFGEEPSQQIRSDLNRLKWVLESGYIPAAVWDAPRSLIPPGGPVV
jgi:uncharacterized membrane protein